MTNDQHSGSTSPRETHAQSRELHAGSATQIANSLENRAGTGDAKDNSMKPNPSNQTNRALTLVEVLVIMAVLFVVVMILLPLNDIGSGRKAQQINCLNNLKEVGLAYQLWAADHNGKFPMEI